MPKRITPLSDVKVRTAKPYETEYKIFGGDGLFLLVTPSGGKLWHFKYRFVNKERKLPSALTRKLVLPMPGSEGMKPGNS